VETSPHQQQPAVATGSNACTVLIAGASFAGLAAAFWLRKLGYSVTVVEIATSIRKGGTPVDIREGVIDVVRRMGLLDRIAAHGLAPRSMEYLDAHGIPVAMQASDADLRDGYEIERDVLLDILFQEVQPDVEFLFGNSISAFRQFPEEVAVTFANGEQRSFSLLLGCDGTHSAIRKMCFGEESSFSVFLENYFSLTIVQKLLIAENTSQLFNIPGKAVMLTAYNNKTDIAFCFFSETEIAYDRRDREQQKHIMRQHFEHEQWRIPELLEELGRCDDFYFDKLCQIRMASWSQGRVALVGDAAYCPSPAAGLGGSMAILGAAALADALEHHPDDLGRALREYDRSFRPTVQEIQRGAVEFGLELFIPRSEEALRQRNSQLTTV